MDYQDFVVQLDASSRGGFRARVVKSPFGEAASSFLLPAAAEAWLAGLPPGALARNVLCLPGGLETVEPSPAEIGTALYLAVFQGPVRSLLDKCRGQIERSPQAGLRLKIKLDPSDPDTAALADLPWELLCDNETEDFFALLRQTSVVRYLDVPRTSQPIPFTPPLRVLAVSGSPRELPPLDLAEEARRLETLRQQGLPIVVQHLTHASAADLRNALVSDSWHVLHFMGHGHFDPATGEGMLAFEGTGGRLDLLSGRAFATKVKDLRTLGVVVLNACDTARTGRRSQVNPFHGVATALVLGGVPAVVAMQRPISDPGAVGFSTAFYRHLASGDSIDGALIEGRQAIHSVAPETFEWAVPVLFLRIPEGNVFAAQPAPEGPAKPDDPAQVVLLATSEIPSESGSIEPVAMASQYIPAAEQQPIEMVERIAKPFELEMIKVAEGPVAPGFGLVSAKVDSVVSEFFVSKAPITNSQFDVYLEATGATRFLFWPKRLTGGRRLGSEPAQVTWHEAVACCRWIRQVSALAIRLPTESEWVNAAVQLDFVPNYSEWCADGFSEEGASSPRDPVMKEAYETTSIAQRGSSRTHYFRVGRNVSSRRAVETDLRLGFRLVISHLFLDWL